MKKQGAIEFAMQNKSIIFMVTAFLLLFGVYGLIHIPKQEFPVFTVREGLVIGVYPGATSSQVEEQLTKPMENYIFGYKEVDKAVTHTVTKDGLMVMYVSLNLDIRNKDEFWSKFRHGLTEFKSSLPSGVVALIANNDFGQTSALLISLEAEDKTYRELEGYLEELETQLRKIPSVSNLRRYGLQQEQISVYLDKTKLAAYRLNTSSLLATLFTQGFTTISGRYENDELSIPLHISETFSNEAEVAEQIIYSDPQGNIIRLKDVARIVREYPEPSSYILNNGKKCILLSIEMLDGNNIVQYGKEVKEVLNNFEKTLPEGASISRIADQSEVVERSVNTFLKEILIAIFTVLVVVMLLQPLRVASVAAMTIPITIFISLGILYLFGFELNTVTLAGLIVVLGIIVDDSVVIIDNYLEKLDQGMSRKEASVSSAKELFKSILSATLAISITFYPILLTTTGMFHEFLLPFPWTVTITLGISLLIAIFFIPYVQSALIKRGLQPKEGKPQKRRISERVQVAYDKLIHLAFRFPKATVSLTIAAILGGIVLFIQLPQKMMPITERNQFSVEIYLPQGASITQTAAVADSLEKILQKDDRITSVTSFIGTSSPRFHTCYAPNFPSRQYAQFIVSTTTIRTTEEVLNDYADKYSNYFSNAIVRFKQLDYVFAPYPVEIRLNGNDISELKTSADEVIALMRKQPHLRSVHHNFEEDLPGIAINLNSDEANRLGISKTTVSSNLAMKYGSGMPVTTVWENDYPVSVVLRTNSDEQDDFNRIADEYISAITGTAVPLHQIASIAPDWSIGQIVRRNGEYSISIYADVKRGKNVVREVKALDKIIQKQIELPQTVSLTWGGAKEQDEFLIPMIAKGLISAIFIIFLILVFHFRKIPLALLILSTATLAIFGGAVGILVSGMEYGLTSVLGIVALMGIIVRNGIIMYDYAEELRLHHGKSAFDAALEAGKRRMRPIFLTSAAASMGVIPMILSKSALWAPMGIVICFGTWFSMLLVVTALPAAYYLVFKNSKSK